MSDRTSSEERSGREVTQPSTLYPLDPLGALVASHEDWLMSRILYYAKAQHYTAYTSTLAEAWRASICGLSDPLLTALKQPPETWELSPEMDFTQDAIAAFGILEAKRHRTRGITLPLFLSLMKYYRQAYLDLLHLGDFSPQQSEYYTHILHRFFDRIELGFCQEWSNHSENEQLGELQTKNRSLTNEKNKYLTIFESLNEAVFFLDEQHNLVNINEIAAQTFTSLKGSGKLYYAGQSLTLKLPWLSRYIKTFDPSRENSEIEKYLPTNQGRRWFEIKAKPMLDVSEKFTGFVVICADITHRKLAEATLKEARKQAEQANQAKSVFLATMSHELRTPLNGILGYTQLLKRCPNLTPKQQEELNIIQQCGYHLLNLINEVLDLSKIESDKLELYPRPVHLPSLLEGLVAIIQPKAEQKDIDLILDLDPRLPLGVYVDEKRLKQVLMNLLNNAIKFTKVGTVTLSVQHLPYSLKKHPNLSVLHSIRLTVKDTGIGISNADIEHIFLPFEQVGDTSAHYEGTGLGLTISQELVKLMGSQLNVRSEQGQGSEFWFDLDLSEVGVESISEISKPAEQIIGYTGRKQKILVIDDRLENRSLLISLLENLDFIVYSATNGQEGLEQAINNLPDLVITDIKMPVMDGFSLTRNLRNLPQFKSLPILAISASFSDLEKFERSDFGYNEFIGKPIDLPEFFAKLQKLLHISWLTARPPDSDPSGVEDSALCESASHSTWKLPPPEELLGIKQALEIGDFKTIFQEIDRLKKLDHLYLKFANRLWDLGQEFADQEIFDLIELAEQTD
ncbi:response regulator [Spirulina subsalsa FACHB-351]|uniref:histidine kinase n=1 Tax=Spirulina subsalsa FACHB-351 TaxID=234711 RepID=A0ABT3LAD8_9CYAN|nr:PAS domain-containing hybrid sensor histidine kinase/response regulator [Spirulina subsalsa]MCW6038464.1 response regulator [Spirulina subsalsa FACHB-351]